MKFLIDAQLPKRLSLFLSEKGFDSIHTIDLPDKNNSPDYLITEFADKELRVVVSKDDDFLQSQIILGKPCKLILVKTGNISNMQLIELFDKNLDLLIREIKHRNIVQITNSEIIT